MDLLFVFLSLNPAPHQLEKAVITVELEFSAKLDGEENLYVPLHKNIDLVWNI